MAIESLMWSTYEHKHVERGSEWYWALGVVALSLGIVSALLGNILFAFVILLGAGLLALVATHPPSLTDIMVNDRGIRVGETWHRWDQIASFWVETEEMSHPTLLLSTTSFLSPHIILPIVDIEPELVRKAFLEYAEEVYMREPLSHKLFEALGF